MLFVRWVEEIAQIHTHACTHTHTHTHTKQKRDRRRKVHIQDFVSKSFVNLIVNLESSDEDLHTA